MMSASKRLASSARSAQRVLQRAQQPSTSSLGRNVIASSSRSTRGRLPLQARLFTTTSIRKQAVPADDVDAPFDLAKVERVADEVDVVIVGGGPAGLSAAIRIKQLAEEKGQEIRVVVLEKGGEVGNHILSGAVIQTNALDELFPNWKEMGAPLNQPALEDHMRFLTEKSSFPMPHP